MLVHVFNSTVVSGPETLVIPSLPSLGTPVIVVFLCERRREADCLRAVEYAKSFGIKTQEVWVQSRYDKNAIRELSQVFENLNPSLIHSHDVKASTYTMKASQISEKSGRRTWKLISTHHGVRGRSGIKIKAYEWFYTHSVLPKFDRVLAVCTSDQKLLVNRGLKSNRVIAHLNGADRTPVAPKQLQGIRSKIRNSWGLTDLGINDDTLLIGFVGRLSPEKRMNRILKICSLIEQKYQDLPQWKLVVFGSGALDSELKQIAHSFKLTDRVLWMGYRAGLGNELAGFDIVISMSDAEGLPVNLVEAGWGGVPVFATQVDGNLDLMPTPDLGVLVNVHESDEKIANQLVDLLKNQTRRESIGRAFQKRVMLEFSGQRWRENLLQIYKNVALEGQK